MKSSFKIFEFICNSEENSMNILKNQNLLLLNTFPDSLNNAALSENFTFLPFYSLLLG